MFGLPGLKNINQYFKIYKISNFENLKDISALNSSKSHYCPILTGLKFFDQSSTISEYREIEIMNMAFPILFIPFLSRTSEIIGKRIFLNIDNKEFLFNFNQSIYSNYLSDEIIEKANNIKIQFLENKNSFNEVEWEEMYKLSVSTYVDETDESKERTAGAGLTDND
tara:strand:- start:1244 stop:1744 length:501 start_codon:yes stop_codon:yes gene_type:complete